MSESSTANNPHRTCCAWEPKKSHAAFMQGTSRPQSLFQAAQADGKFFHLPSAVRAGGAERATLLSLPHGCGWYVAATCAGCMAVLFWSPQAMARRSVRRFVRTKSRTDQVCGAKKRYGHAVYPQLEQETTIHILLSHLRQFRKVMDKGFHAAGGLTP